jgi:methyl-accepting chemotaxis protein
MLTSTRFSARLPLPSGLAKQRMILLGGAAGVALGTLAVVVGGWVSVPGLALGAAGMFALGRGVAPSGPRNIPTREVPATPEPERPDEFPLEAWGGGEALREQPRGLGTDLKSLPEFGAIMERQLQNVCEQTATAASDILSGLSRIEQALPAARRELGDAARSDAVLDIINDAETCMARCRAEIADLDEQRQRNAKRGAVQIGAIKAKTQELSNLVGEVRGVAHQTKLLAFNASIEAARNGDRAGGFGVIAVEIKDLANAVDRVAAAIGEGVGELATTASEAFRVTIDERDERERQGYLEVNQSMGHLGTAFDRLVGHQREVLETIRAENNEVASAVMNLAGCVQFQDIVRQQTEGVMTCWHEVIDHLVTRAEAPNPADERELTDIIEGLYDRYVMSSQRSAHAGENAADTGQAIELF